MPSHLNMVTRSEIYSKDRLFLVVKFLHDKGVLNPDEDAINVISLWNKVEPAHFGLVWKLIYCWGRNCMPKDGLPAKEDDVVRQQLALASSASSGGNGKEKVSSKEPLSAVTQVAEVNADSEALLQWVRSKVADYPRVMMHDNLVDTFANGMALCALAHSLIEGVFDFTRLDEQRHADNIEVGMHLFSEYYGIAMRDVDDEQSLQEYISEIKSVSDNQASAVFVKHEGDNAVRSDAGCGSFCAREILGKCPDKVCHLKKRKEFDRRHCNPQSSAERKEEVCDSVRGGYRPCRDFLFEGECNCQDVQNRLFDHVLRLDDFCDNLRQELQRLRALEQQRLRDPTRKERAVVVHKLSHPGPKQQSAASNPEKGVSITIVNRASATGRY